LRAGTICGAENATPVLVRHLCLRFRNLTADTAPEERARPLFSDLNQISKISCQAVDTPQGGEYIALPA
jgi:hypothetical protein